MGGVRVWSPHLESKDLRRTQPLRTFVGRHHVNELRNEAPRAGGLIEMMSEEAGRLVSVVTHASPAKVLKNWLNIVRVLMKRRRMRRPINR